jgi:hypothetical protein
LLAVRWMPRASILTAVAAVAALAGCATYSPGSFAHGAGPEAEFAGQRVTVGCLDVAIARRPDHASKAVIQYRFGNRCNRSIVVDLQRVVVIGRLDDGAELQLSPYDPDAELRPARLDGLRAGGEAIAYQAPRDVAEVCVDAASIVHAEPARWLCFGIGIQEES